MNKPSLGGTIFKCMTQVFFTPNFTIFFPDPTYFIGRFCARGKVCDVQRLNLQFYRPSCVLGVVCTCISVPPSIHGQIWPPWTK